MRNRRKAEKVKKRRTVIAVTIEIAVMAVGVLCVMLPLPWRLVVPIVIGARSIIRQAVNKSKEPPPPKVIHCCGGGKEDKPKKERKSIEKARQTDSKKAAENRG